MPPLDRKPDPAAALRVLMAFVPEPEAIAEVRPVIDDAAARLDAVEYSALTPDQQAAYIATGLQLFRLDDIVTAAETAPNTAPHGRN